MEVSRRVVQMFYICILVLSTAACGLSRGKQSSFSGEAHLTAGLGPGSRAGERLELSLPDRGSMAFRWIPPGSFVMGSPKAEEGRFGDENQVTVLISQGFWMAETEVTQAQYRAVTGTNPSHSKSFFGRDRAEQPVEQVSWNDAVDFCQKLSSASGVRVSLPTEAQWEYACRAGTVTRFHSGDADSDLRRAAFYTEPPWIIAIGSVDMSPVGQKEANAWGLLDMHGNVWEWCADWYSEELRGGTDPAGPPTGSFRVIRGGFAEGARNLRSARRLKLDPSDRTLLTGFRPIAIPGIAPSEGRVPVSAAN